MKSIRTMDEVCEFFSAESWQGSRLGLERMEELMELLGNPERGLRFIHVAGSNGKGSAAAMLASILAQAGYKTGLYTSPHLMRVNERLKINGTEITDAELIEAAEQIRPTVEKLADPPTEFERITALAFCWFARQHCDVVVLEVGLGGRLDATNVIPAPDAAVIMNIALEHTAVLGNTLEKIAAEKAGIIKPGTPTVLYRQTAPVQRVVEEVCREKGAPLRITRPELGQGLSGDLEGQLLDYRSRRELRVGLPGAYQRENTYAVLDTVDLLTEQKGYTISEEAIRQGLALARWPGRLEVLHHEPLVLVDGAHNPDGVEALTASLQEYFPDRKLTFVMGVMADKDYEEMLRLTAPLADQFITVTPECERALSSGDLADRIRKRFHVPARDEKDVPSGLDRALRLCGRQDVICVFGSLYQAGMVREYMQHLV